MALARNHSTAPSHSELAQDAISSGSHCVATYGLSAKAAEASQKVTLRVDAMSSPMRRCHHTSGSLNGESPLTSARPRTTQTAVELISGGVRRLWAFRSWVGAAGDVGAVVSNVIGCSRSTQDRRPYPSPSSAVPPSRLPVLVHPRRRAPPWRPRRRALSATPARRQPALCSLRPGGGSTTRPAG